MVNVFDENVVVNGVVFPCCIETNLSDEDFLGLVATKWGGWSKSQLHEWTYRSRSNGNFSDLVLRRDGIYVGKNNPSSSDGIVLVKSDGSGKWVVLGYMPDNLKELVMILENGDPDEKERMGWNSLPGSILLLFLSVSSISSLTFSLMSFFMAIKGYLNEGKVSCAFSKLACHEAEFWVTYSIGWFLLFVLLFIVSFCLVQILKKKKRHSKFY